MWTLYGFGITFVILLSYREIYARVLPELPASKESTELDAATTSLLDQVSASKLECLLEFIENPDAKPQCIDKLFGDERSQYLLDELRNELNGNFLPDEEIEAGDADDQDKDQLVADLNTLSEKSGPLSTVNDDIPIINSDIEKRVDEQVDTPKKEQQRNALGESIPEVTAEVVKSDDGNENNEANQIDNDDDSDEYEYDSSLVAKLYNMLQEMVMKETFDYGLNMNADDHDSSEEEEPQNIDENTTVAEESQQQEEESEEEDNSDSEEEEDDEETKTYANELDTNNDSDEDELGNELQQIEGDRGQDSEESEKEDFEEDVQAIENDLVKELDKMLKMAKQAVADKTKTKDISDEIVSSDKFLDDLRHMEKALKESTT